VKRLFTMLIVLSMAFTMAWAQNDLTLTFEDDTDVANWDVHGGTDGYTTVAQDATAGVGGTGAIVFGDGGYGFYIKRPITATAGTAYNFSVDVKTTGWADAWLISVTVEGLSTVEPTVVIDNATGADFVTYTLAGIADAGTAGYILFSGGNTLITNSVTIDNMVFDDDVAPPPPSTVFISELADPNNGAGLRFVELYNSSGVAVDLAEGSGWLLNKYTNDSETVSNSLELTGTIPANGTFVIATGVADADFEASYGVAPDMFDGEDNFSAGSNGDDNIELVDGTGTVVDLFGIPGEDGSGTSHEFEDGRAVRLASVTVGNPIWDPAEWAIDSDAPSGIGPVDAPDGFDPFVWPTPNPLVLISAFSISDTEIEVVYSGDLATANVADYSLLGTAATFTSATIDGADATLLHLVSTAPILADFVADTLVDAAISGSFELYAGITPIAFTNALNAGGTIELAIPATFAGLITADDGYNNVWISDGGGAYMGILIYDSGFDDLVNVGDAIMLTGELDVYNNLSELKSPMLLGIQSSGNPVVPAMIAGATIDSSLAPDTNPAEQWEGQLVKIEGATVLSFDSGGYFYELSDDGGTTKFLLGDNVDYHLGSISMTVGDVYDIVGVVDYDSYDGGYRINPRDMGDVIMPVVLPTVTFRVNIAHKILEGVFDPATDYVDVAGDFNGWGPAEGEWQLTEDPDTNGFWIGEFPIEAGEYGFKFRISSSWNPGEHDGGDNRMLVVGDHDTGYFGYLDNFTMWPVVQFGVDLTDKFAQGTFDPTVDSVNVAGSFNGWGGDPGDLQPMIGDDLKWGAYIDQDGLFTTGETIEFKFRVNKNWDNAESVPDRTLNIADGLQSYKAFWDDYDYNLAVTFEVNMNAKMAAGEFDPTTQYVDVAGNFNGWGPATDTWVLSDDDIDGIWTLTVIDSFTVGQELEFKFRIDSDWELAEFPGGSNRQYIVGSGAQSYSVWWNDFDPNFVGAPVTFKVNMNAQIDASAFDVTADNVFITGVFGAIAMDDADADGIYEVTEDVPVGVNFYRFRINDDTPETLPFDRSVVVEEAGTPIVLDPVWFSNVDVVRYGSGDITFVVDMTVLESLGFYNRALGDSLELRGGVNGWGSDPDRTKIDMIRDPGSEIYFLTVDYDGNSGDVFTYKFFLNLHQTAGGDTAMHAGEDFFEYELPAGSGGGDRHFVWDGLDGSHVLPIQTYQDYVTEGVIPEGTTIEATLFMDMSGAMMYEDDAFDPENDMLYFIQQDSWGAELQGNAAGKIAADSVAYVPAPEMGLNIWKTTIAISGPAPHALMYTTRYIKADDTEVDEMGSGFGFGRFRTQWLKPGTVGGPIVSDQPLAVVMFSNLGTPLEVEPEPYANSLTYEPDSVDGLVSAPTSFTLSQNYPNPFNPTTSISYVLPQAVNVELIVFDITGREINRLVDNRTQNAGRYNVMWNGLNSDGRRAASGLYFYKIIAGDFQQTNKMLMLK